MELDTYKRHNVPVICVVGNDACWTQIYRLAPLPFHSRKKNLLLRPSTCLIVVSGQMDIFGDDAGCTLDYTEYHSVAKVRIFVTQRLLCI